VKRRICFSFFAFAVALASAVSPGFSLGIQRYRQTRALDLEVCSSMRDSMMAIAKYKTTLIAIAVGICVTLLILGISSIPHLDNAMFLLLPGVFFAALFFSTGINSDFPVLFILLAGLADIALYAAIAALVYRIRETKRTPQM
jgi:hypothetical protein